MAKQIIAVDLDDVLAASAKAWVEFSNQRWGTNLTIDDYNEDWAKMWQVDRHTESERAREIHRHRLFSRFDHDADAHDVLKKLSRRYTLVIATSRIYKIHDDTLEWLDKYYNGIFADVHHTGFFDEGYEGPMPEGAAMKTKAGLINRIGADFLIDDQPKHCLAVAEHGVEAILFGNYKWGREIGALPPHVTRCTDWGEVEAYFEQRG